MNAQQRPSDYQNNQSANQGLPNNCNPTSMYIGSQGHYALQAQSAEEENFNTFMQQNNQRDLIKSPPNQQLQQHNMQGSNHPAQQQQNSNEQFAMPLQMMEQRTDGGLCFMQDHQSNNNYPRQMEFSSLQTNNDNSKDFAMASIHSGMKLLENRYIDLANFYKNLMQKEQMISQKLILKGNFDKNIVHQFERKRSLKQQDIAIKENALIHTLIKVKDELEVKMQDLRDFNPQTMVGEAHNVDDEQQNQGNGRQQPVYSEETHKFLQQTLQELLGQLDKSQVASLHVLSTKQYDMFDLATKKKLPSALRNDYLGHWYDAKTIVSQNFADLKTTLLLRQQMAQVQFKLQANGAPVTDLGQFGDQASNLQSVATFGQNEQRSLVSMMGEFTRYKAVVEKQAEKIKTVMLALKVKDKTFKDQQAISKAKLQELAQSIKDQLTINEGRLQIQRSVSPSGTQNAPGGVMSPYQKRLQTYQQSSLQRSTPQNRTPQNRPNSRGQRLSREGKDATQLSSSGHLNRSTIKKSTNVFYADHTDSSDLKVIHNKLSQFQTAFEDAVIANKQKLRYESELLKQMNSNLSKQLMYIGQNQSIMDYNVPSGDSNQLEELRQLVNQEKDILFCQLSSPVLSIETTYNNQNSLPAVQQKISSQFGSQEPLQQVKQQRQQEPLFEIQTLEDQDLETQSNQSMTQVNKVRNQRVQELQDSNDQLFSELRKANEKYLDVRVENNKLKDQIQTLKVSVDQLRSDKNQAQSRQRALSSSGQGAYTAASRKRSDTGQGQSQADAELRKTHDIMKTETLQVCTMVKTFMTAMRALQKAVSRKEPDMTSQKRSFDQAKRQLEESVEQTLTKLTNQASSSGTELTSNKNVSGSSGNMKIVSTMMRGQSSTAGFNQQREVSGGRMIQSASMSMRPASFNATAVNSKRSGQGSRHTREDQENLNLLTKQVRSLQLEKEKLKELIEELKQTNQLFSGEKDLLEGKIKSKTAQLHKFASQCQASASKVFMLEQVLTDYKLTVEELGQNEAVTSALSNSGSESVQQQTSVLQAKEYELKSKLDEEISKMMVNSKIDPQFVALRDELKSQVQLKERLLDQQFSQLTFRVAEKEEDLQRLKLLFVDKLRELESSFVEISHEVVETDKVTQDMTAKRKQEIQNLIDAKPLSGVNNLDKSMEAILSNLDNDENSRQMEELIQANHELMEENEKLKAKIIEASGSVSNSYDASGDMAKKQTVSDNLHAEMVIELNEQIDEARQEAEKFKMQIKLSSASEAMSKKEIQGLKYDNKRMTMDLKDSKERFEKVKMDYQQQFQTLKSTTVAMKSQLQKEYDARTTNETKYLASQKQLKLARQENQEQQAEMLLLMKRMEDLHSELAYLKELRGDDSDEDATDDGEDEIEETKKEPEKDQDKATEDKKDEKDVADDSESPPAKDKKTLRAQRKEEEDLLEREARIAEDSQDAARYYHHLVKVTKQEFKSMKKQHAKITTANDQEQNLNSKLQDLETEKQELAAQMLKKTKGTKIVICLQNYVRKMLQEKLEQSAKELEALGSKNKAAMQEAETFRSKATQLESDFQDTIKGHDRQMSDLELNISEVRNQLVDAEKQKQTMREEARLAKEQEQKITKELEQAKSPERQPALTGSEAELREKITEELEEKHKIQMQEMIQTYKRAQRSSNEKHQAALLTLENQLSDSPTNSSKNSASDQVSTIRLQLQSEHETMTKKLEQEHLSQLNKSKKATKLMICLQNKMQQMVAAKLQTTMADFEKKNSECISLKEDLSDVTEAHSAKLILMRQTFDKEKQDETAKIIQQYEDSMKSFETKIRTDVQKDAQTETAEQLSTLRLKLEESTAINDKQKKQTKRLTKLMICLQEYVRKMLTQRLEKREQELQLEIVTVKESVSDYCDRLKTKEEEFEKFKELKSQEESDSSAKIGQIDAADAQIQSLKSVQEALEREKDDLLIQNETMEEELHSVKTELLELKGTSEVKDMRIEELEERIGEYQHQTEGMNRTSELGSSGKIVHQGDDLRSLEMGSDGANDSFRTADNNSNKGGQNLQQEQQVEMLTAENADLRDQIEKLRQDLDASVLAAGGTRNSWDGSVGRGSWGSDGSMSKNKQVEDHLKHVRQIMTQFLSRLPETTRENEDILPVVFSMLNFPPDEINSINEARALLNEKTTKKGGGMFGGLMNKKK